MKKFISVFLSCLLVFSVCSIAASAVQIGDTGSFKVFNYNVAGLPDVGFITGGESKNVLSNQIDIGKFINASDFDIFAVQEDFGYNENLTKFMTNFAYKTVHHGGVPYGDGTNIYTKNFKMYNEQHITWEQLYGIADDGADALSQKGITYCCIEVSDGVLIDFYDIHADAYGDEGSVNARKDNFRQLRDLINSRTVDRPVIVVGDFNEYLFGDYSNLGKMLVEDAGLKDAWVEYCNSGNYTDASYYVNTYGSNWGQKWGKWDSVERIMYKDGGGISLDCTYFDYMQLLNRDGVSCSDHCASFGYFTYTVNQTPTVSDDLSDERPSGFAELIRRVVAFFKALFLAISNFDSIKEYLGK